jgi:cytochrome c oxidase subunit 3
VRGPGAQLFFTLYFLITGLHGIHVVIGMTVLIVVGIRAARGAFDVAYHTPVELAGLYWHLVDLIWIFVFPLIYLI